MNDRQNEIIETTVDSLMPYTQGRTRDQVHEALYNLVIDCRQLPRSTTPEVLRRTPIAGEVLPPHQRASWARSVTEHDVIVSGDAAPFAMMRMRRFV